MYVPVQLRYVHLLLLLLLLLHLHHLQRIHPWKRHGHPRQSWHATKRHPRLWDAHLRRHLLRNLCVWVRRQLRHSRYCRGRPAIGMGRRSYARRRWSYPSRPRLLLLAGVSCDFCCFLCIRHTVHAHNIEIERVLALLCIGNAIDLLLVHV
jgi:hypothetical protein